MAEVKMGTNYVREIAESFRNAAGTCKSAAVKAKLGTLADEMDALAGKLFFKTQKGTEDMAALAKKLEGIGAKLAPLDEAGAVSYTTPIFTEIEKVLEMVKNMKVRMT